MPRHEDYLAGGRLVARSYYADLYAVAQRLVADTVLTRRSRTT